MFLVASLKFAKLDCMDFFSNFVAADTAALLAQQFCWLFSSADSSALLTQQLWGFEREKRESLIHLYIFIKENLLIPEGGFSRTPPKLEGLGEWNLDPTSTSTCGVSYWGWFWGSTHGAALRLKKVLENAVLMPWHTELWSWKREFWV